MNKRVLYSVVYAFFGVLFFWGFSLGAQAAEKNLTVDLSTEYKSCTFSIEMAEPGDYTGVIIGPDGKEYVCAIVDDQHLICDVDKVKVGTWQARIIDEGKDELAKCTISVKARKESSTTVVDDDIRVGKDLVGLSMYFRDRTLVVNWTDESAGNVNVKVVNLDTAEILFSETVKNLGCEVDIPDSVTNISVSVVPSTSANIEGAAQSFTYIVDPVARGTVDFDDIRVTKSDAINAHISLSDSYGFYVENNGNKVYEEGIKTAGEYDVTIPLSEDGANEIVFYLVDADKNKYSFTHSVIRDTVAPKLSLDSEYNGVYTYDSVLTISGSVSDYSTLSLNESPITVATDGTFTCDASLHLGENKLYIAAFDEAGNEISYELYVTMIEPEKKNNNIPMAVICALLAVLAGIVYVLLGKIKKRSDASDVDTTTSRSLNGGESTNKGKVARASLLKRKGPMERAPKLVETQNGDKKSKRFSKRQIVNFASYGVWVLACIYVFFVVLQFCVAASGSMEPTIITGERYVVNRFAYKMRAVETGDIISFNMIDPNSGLKERYTKRVVGVGGDEITFKDGYVFINGKQLDESEYLDEDVETNCMKTFNVPTGYVFVLGDNREYSYDSRYWDDPYVLLSEINGKYLFSIPFTR